MKKSIVLLLTLITISCGDTDTCDYYNEFQEADFLMLKIVDKDTGQDLLFGDNRKIDFSDINVRLKSDNGDYVSTFFDFAQSGQDSVFLISLLETASPASLSFSLRNELIIDYGNQYPSDSIKIEHSVAGYCEEKPLLYDYNVILNDENICNLCFRDIVEIQK